jgi:hypothetical protein
MVELINQIERFIFCRDVQRDDDFVSRVAH